MAFEPVTIQENRRAVKYDGTNSGNLNAAISDFQITSETPTHLTFTSGGQSFTVARNGWVAWYQGEVTEVFQNDSDYQSVYTAATALANHVHDLVLTTGPAKPGPTQQ